MLHRSQISNGVDANYLNITEDMCKNTEPKRILVPKIPN